MNRFRYEAFLQEFPFLRHIMCRKSYNYDSDSFDTTKSYLASSELRNPDEVDSITVSRADENLLAMVPSKGSWDGSLGESYHWSKVHFVLADGSIKEDYVRQKERHGSNYAHSQTEEREGETVLEALVDLGNPDDVQYIVWEFRDYSDWEGQERVDVYKLDIYKPPKGVRFSDLIAKAREKALAQVKAEANF